ncbi:hypothetical protein JW796_01080 [Candidatus Dojkabacteria bacterium]|nr:hypothetical protein [Candidatus Dojkabacteria bacterium]
MYDAIIDFINFNEGLNYKIIIFVFIAYVVLLWMVVVFWVYFDAKKRYVNPIHSLVIAIATFFLGIPFVLLYMLIRPDEVFDDEGFLEEPKGGVNIPIVNFTGKEGVEMTLTLSVSPKVNEVRPSDLRIGVSVEPNEEKFEIKEIDRSPVEYSGRKEFSLSSDIKRGLMKLKNMFQRRRKPFVEEILVIDESNGKDIAKKDKKKKKKKKKK